MNTPYYTKAESDAIEANLRRQYNYGASEYRGFLTIAQTPTLDGWYWATEIGTYTNAGGLVTLANKINMIEKDGSTFRLYGIDAPALVGGITDWTAQSYITGEIVSHLGKLWKSNDATISTDVPSTSSKWGEVLTGYLSDGTGVFELTNTSDFNSQNNGTPDYTFFNPNPITVDSVIKELKINGTAGTMSILVINFNPSTGERSIVSETGLTIVNGVNEIVVDIPVSQGNYVGIYLNTANVKYNPTGTYSDYASAGKLDDVPTLTSGRNIDFGFTIESGGITDRLVSLENTQNNNIIPSINALELIPSGVVAENETKFVGWTNSGFAIVNNIMESSTNGAVMTSQKRFGFENRIIECLFVPKSSTSKFVIASEPSEQAIYSGSSIRVNLTNNRIEVLERYAFNILGTVIHSFTPSFTLTANVKYKIQIELNGRVFSFKIAKENTTAGFKMFDNYELLGSATSTPLGYKTFPSVWNYGVGTMQGNLRLINEAGGVKIISVTHTLKCVKSPLLYLCGDSITEGFSVDDNSKYGGLLQKYFGQNNVALSGIGGATSNSALARIQTEILKLRPKYFIPYFGSNVESSVDFLAGMNAIITLAQSINCTVILCTIPTQGGLSGDIATLADTYNLDVIDFRIVLTNAGTVYPDFYNNIDSDGTPYTDNLHPNPLGHFMMANEVLKYLL